MLKFETYAENVRMAGKTKDNPHGCPLSIREVSNAIGVSYEAVRQLWKGSGKLMVSRLTNDSLSRFLGLPEDEMWALAQREKVSRKIGYVPMQLIKDGEGRELTKLWGELTEEHRQIVLRMARSLVMETRKVTPTSQHSASV